MEAAHIHAPTARELAGGRAYDGDAALPEGPRGAVEAEIDELDRLLGLLADRLDTHAVRIGPALYPGHAILAEALLPADGEDAARHSELAESLGHRNARLQTMVLQLEALTHRIDL